MIFIIIPIITIALLSIEIHLPHKHSNSVWVGLYSSLTPLVRELQNINYTVVISGIPEIRFSGLRF